MLRDKSGSWLRRHGHKLDDQLKKRMEHPEIGVNTKNPGKPVRVIVQFHDDHVHKHHAALKQSLHPKHYAGHVRLGMIRAFAVKATSHSIRSLCECKHVKRVYADKKKKVTLNVATPTVGAAAAQTGGLTGKGVGIAIVDTGVYRHPDLTKPKNRIIGFKDFINNRKTPYDDNGHGTHCSGDAAGNGYRSGGKYKGPAAEANIIGVKVLDSQGSGYDSVIIQGIEWCLKNRKRYNIRVLSMSLGGTAATPCKDDVLCQAVNEAVRQGIVVAVSAGNSGPGAGTIETPGISRLAITVGATDDHNKVNPAQDTVASFSSRGPAKGNLVKPDIVAPGVSIISLRAPGSTLDREYVDSRVGTSYFKLSGTSMSTPIVAGTAAQLLQKYPRWTPAQVKASLRTHARSLGAGSYAQGRGLLDVRYLAAQTRSRTRVRRGRPSIPFLPARKLLRSS
jgi:serine protease AprX